MGNKTKATLAILAAAAVIAPVALTATASNRVYEISGGSGGDLIWHRTEAYFFIEVSDLGYSWSRSEYLWVLFKRHVVGGFAVAEFPTDGRAYLDVLRVSSTGVERYVLKLASRFKGGPGTDPARFTPMEDHVFASCPWLIGHFTQNGQTVAKGMDDGLCRWEGDHFEKATEEEKNRLAGIHRLTTEDFRGDENGWSRIAFGAEHADRKFTIDVGGDFQIAVKNVARDQENSTVTIDLIRSGKAAERLATFQSRFGQVSQTEYDRTFHDGP